MGAQEKLVVWTCANDASLLVIGLSPSAAEAPAEIPPASAPSPVLWICHLTCVPCLGACPIKCYELNIFK